MRISSLTRWCLLAAACILFGAGAAPAATKIHVVATTPNLASLAQSVGGDLVEVTAIANGHQDPHYVQARPSYARLINDADLVVANGLELEVGWLPPLLETARNPKVRPGSTGFLEASSAVTRILEVPTGSVDRSNGDVHPFGNPHLDLDPRNGIAIARAIGAALSRLDPSNAETYARNADAFAADLERRIADWKTKAATLEGRPLVSFHKEWEYLEDWLGFRLVGYVEDRAGIPPSPKHLADLTETMQRDKVERVVAACYNDVRACEGLAARAGAQVSVLPTQVGAVPEVKNYPDLFQVIIDTLVQGSTRAH